MELYGNVVDVINRTIYWGVVEVEAGRVAALQRLEGERAGASYILPGFVDAHVHIESSMLVPAEFARLAVVHGTVATVSDPHEIANVCGIAGVEFMIENGNTVPFKFNFGAPSCVPATTFETAGATLDAAAVKLLLQRKEIRYLTEMMNFPGVLAGDREVTQKIASARAAGKPVDGHAPGLRGADAKKYIDAGISTDHECFTAEEAEEKLKYGMKILIREGSAAKNFDALIPLLHSYPDRIMFCSDDKHPDSLVDGHINGLVERAMAAGVDVFNVLQAACVNPVLHYGLDVGLLRAGDAADLIVVNNLRDFRVEACYIDGVCVAEDGESRLTTGAADAAIVNHFNCSPKKAEQFAVPGNGGETIAVIEALDGQLITNRREMVAKVANGQMVSDTSRDLLKIVVVNRYSDAPIATAFITNFGLKEGAIASSVAHDSHNIVAVGVDDAQICRAVNAIIAQRGGIAVAGPTEDEDLLLPLPVAGLMSTGNGYAIAERYKALDRAAKALGSTLSAPFMTLSFMALLVIPHLKLSDKGLFDGDKFELTGVQM